MIKNALLVTAIACLCVNIYVVTSNPPGPIIHRRAEIREPNSYRLQLEKQFHTRYGTELSYLHRMKPNLLSLELKKLAADKALKALQERQGSIDPATYDTAVRRLLLLQSEAEHSLKVGVDLHQSVSRMIKRLTVFGTTRFYMDEIDATTLDRTYRGNLSIEELELANVDLETLILEFREELRHATEES